MLQAEMSLWTHLFPWPYVKIQACSVPLHDFVTNLIQGSPIGIGGPVDNQPAHSVSTHVVLEGYTDVAIDIQWWGLNAATGRETTGLMCCVVSTEWPQHENFRTQVNIVGTTPQ